MQPMVFFIIPNNVNRLVASGHSHDSLIPTIPPSTRKVEKRYESGGIKPKLCSYRPGSGNSNIVHLFGFVASNGGADAADINVGADAADNDTTMQATFFTYKLI